MYTCFVAFILFSSDLLATNNILNTSDIDCGELSQPCMRCCKYTFAECPQTFDHFEGQPGRDIMDLKLN